MRQVNGQEDGRRETFTTNRKERRKAHIQTGTKKHVRLYVITLVYITVW